ncbi:alpha/beta hydrolase [Kurthia sibirica]|uniref:AB hydrolase-1 domain-containing protein n=1 Tax=Kurthia sibirica TaxID=202750 RepID=A0A2U3AR29_9BACL|nr:alpha/beta hydrolase [Kurthia sibirica]PWI27002.1 hypothetical protein DEX24_01530 [Kurthia sibirica]GEK34454.1 alpha/beta hydrolase [Kurthia sibirica]
MRKKWPIVASAAIGLTGASVAAIGYQLSNKIMYIKRKDGEFILNREITAQRLNLDWYDRVAKESFTVDSPFGYTIHCHKINSIVSNNTMIISHGVKESHVNSLKYAPLFARLGYNIVIYDQRRHGSTGGKTTSYGYYEKSDLAAVTEEVRNRIGQDAILGLQGESMGAATALQYAGDSSSKINFVIADCPFTSFHDQLNYLMARDSPFKSSSYAIKFVDFFIKRRDGYSLEEISPKAVIAHIHKPILFIHSALDTFIPPAMSQELFTLKQNNKRLKIFPKGAHAQSYNEQPLEYEKEIIRFLVDFNISDIPKDYQCPPIKA